MLKHKNILALGFVLLVLLIVLKAGWWAYAAVFVLVSGLASWGSFDIRLGYFVKTFYHNPNEKQRKIALTFDDGPNEITHNVLDLLQKHNAKATFFCIGKQIEKHPDIFKRIIAENHTVGNHSYSHSNSFGFFSTEKVREEISRTDTIIEEISGKKARLFRPPFGVTNPNIAKAVVSTKHDVIGWNIRSLDTVITDESKIFKRIKKGIHPGGIILMHDTSLKTVTVLEQTLLFLQSEKYEMVTVDNLLNLSAYEN